MLFQMTLQVSGNMQEGEEDGGGTEGKWLVLPAKVKTFLHTGENLKSNG